MNSKKARVLLPWNFQSTENERHSSNRHRINRFIPLVPCMIVEIKQHSKGNTQGWRLTQLRGTGGGGVGTSRSK